MAPSIAARPFMQEPSTPTLTPSSSNVDAIAAALRLRNALSQVALPASIARRTSAAEAPDAGRGGGPEVSASARRAPAPGKISFERFMVPPTPNRIPVPLTDRVAQRAARV